jgi:hypothetical protein
VPAAAASLTTPVFHIFANLYFHTHLEDELQVEKKAQEQHRQPS